MKKNPNSEKPVDWRRSLPFWRRFHYVGAYIPIEQLEETSLELHERAGNLESQEEIIAFVQTRFNKYKEFLETSDYSGFYSTLAFFLHHSYQRFLGDARCFIYCYYPLIVCHLFAPPEKLDEQSIGYLGKKRPLHFNSTLTRISYDIRACHLYSHARFLGRVKFLSHFSAPYVGEVFKGLEYLAKLYYCKTDNTKIAKTFKSFLREFTELSEDLLHALWLFRCGLVHASTLYNVRKEKIFRFAYGWQGLDDPPIVRMSYNQDDFLKGDKYRVNCASLYAIFLLAKSFVFQDMLYDFGKYVTNPRFHIWLRRLWTMQYLPDKDEYHKMKDLIDVRELKFAHYQKARTGQKLVLHDEEASVCDLMMYLCDVPAKYVLKFELIKVWRDIRSRLRDLFSQY